MKRSAIRVGLGVRVLVVSLLIVVAGFTTATVISLHEAKGIEEAASGVSSNAAPSIQRLLEARTELGIVRRQVEHNAHFGARDGDVREAVAQLRTSVAAYLALPSYASEREVWSDLITRVGEFANLASRIDYAVARGDRDRARSLAEQDLPIAFDAVADALTRSTRANVDEVEQLTADITRARARAQIILIAMDAVAALLAVALAFLAIRLARREARHERQGRALLEASARERGLFAERVAHDLLSPLTSTSIALQSIARSPERAADLASAGLRGLRRTEDIVRDLLEFARAGGPASAGARADLGPVIDDVVEAARFTCDDPDVTFDVAPEPPTCAVAAPTGVLASILTNIVSNAVKYIGRGPEKRICIRVSERPGAVHVEVEDTGPGIAPGLRERIFEPYARIGDLSRPGIGLGLATVKRLVEAYGGSTGARPREPRGTVLWFELPCVPRA